MAVLKATDVKVYYNGVYIDDCDSANMPSVTVDATPKQEWRVNVSGYWIDKDSYFMRRLARRLAY